MEKKGANMHEDNHFKGAGGLSIFYQAWVPESYRASLAIAHGLGEHSGRYAHLAGFLNEKGIACFALDHRGHGRSGGRRGHVMSFSEYLDDMEAFWKIVREKNSGRKTFALGHSMGGLIATLWAMRHPEGLAGLIISSAAYAVKIEASPVKLALGRFFSRYAPSLSMSNGIDPNNISRDKDVVRRYIEDPLVHDKVSARWYTSFMQAMEDCNERASELNVPILIMQSGNDRLVDPEGAPRFHSKVGSGDKTLKIWDGFFHEMFNELEKEKVYKYTLEWLEKHLA
jgi:acylglycerol lipase